MKKKFTGVFKSSIIVMFIICLTTMYFNNIKSDEIKPFMTDDFMLTLTEEYGVDKAYIAQYNDKDNFISKVNELSKSTGDVEDVDYGQYIEREIIKIGFLDSNKQIPIEITESYRIYKFNKANSNALERYRVVYKVMGLLALIQNVEYYTRLNGGLNTASANIVNVFGQYDGIIGGGTSYSSHSNGFTNNNWAQTVFQYSYGGIASNNMIAKSYLDVYGIWHTTWS